MEPITGTAALTRADDGRVVDPQDREQWRHWVSATRGRNWLNDDPLLDWLDRYGEDKGFVPDDKVEGFEPRTSFRDFVFEKGDAFEAGVIDLLARDHQVVTIATDWEDSRSLEAAEKTIGAMRERAEIIAQAVLRDPQHRTYGMADLLVRSDVLAGLFDEDVSLEESANAAPGIGLGEVHYRVIDIKYRGLGIKADGSLGQSADTLAYQSQVWVYNTALGRIQGYTPPAGYLLGRNWMQRRERGTGCLERIGRVNMDGTFDKHAGASLRDLTLRAHRWIREVRQQGAEWEVLPIPSRPELYPHMRHNHDDPWHGAKAEIGRQLEELTLLPGVNPIVRADAHAKGLRHWSDAGVSAKTLGIGGRSGEQCDAVLAANRSDEPVLLPSELTLDGDDWREPAALEFYVDFETVSNMNDDFSTLPAMGGLALIFQVGCGRLEDGAWRFDQWTVDRLDVESERAMMDRWIGRMRGLCEERGITLDQARIVHWSHAEKSTLDSAYNSARKRHPDARWPADLPWFDLLMDVVKPGLLSVTGAFNYGLKSIAKSMHDHGWTRTAWGDGPTDGLGAMVAAWRVDAAVSQNGGRLLDDPLMREVADYNRVDCQVMAELLEFLRDRNDD